MMKTTTVFLSLILLLTGSVMNSTKAVAAHDEDGVSLAPEDKAAIKAVVHEWELVWNEHKMSKLTPILTEDAEWVNVVGMWWRGRAEIVRALEAFHATMFSHVQLHEVSLDIRAITPDVVIATETISQDAYNPLGGTEVKAGLTRCTYTLVKRNGSWLVASGHNTIINPEAQKNDPIQRSKAPAGTQ
jgi:uncharacterized protein (TIGR02246 family)